MSKRKQIVLSAALIIAAATVVGLYGRTTGQEETSGGMEGHVHGAVGGDDRSPVHLDGEKARRIGVTYSAAELKQLERTVRTVALVAYDETRVVNVNPKIDGWIEHLHVDFTGAPVRAGDPLLEIYSPALVSAQEELILAQTLVKETAEQPESRAAANARRLLESARRRLAYWDIPADQIARLESSAEPRRTLLLRVPANGIVIEKNVFEGTRIAPGMNVYRIADLSRVWVEGDVFEKDLSLVELGQMAMVRFEAYPGETFHGAVTYVYPTVSLEARTGRIRVELQNPDLRLRPGMYAEIEMNISSAMPRLVIPRSAVFGTGERMIVFVREEDGMLTPREVTPGLPVGLEVEILAGLQPGEVVVSSASFLIDAEANLGAAAQTMPGMEMEDSTAPSQTDHTGHGSEAH
jgi:Cu(I)/Ag(I) efflux system membrane fusion protein